MLPVLSEYSRTSDLLHIHSSEQLNQNEGRERLTSIFNLRLHFLIYSKVSFHSSWQKDVQTALCTLLSLVFHISLFLSIIFTLHTLGFCSATLFQHPPTPLTLSFSLSVDVRHLIKVSTERPTQTTGFVFVCVRIRSLEQTWTHTHTHCCRHG